jgi:lipopolysaccharide biosynthesis regulator YciM
VSALQNLDWTWPAIGLAFSLGVAFSRWAYLRWGAKRKGKVNQEYFRGLNFLLNEEPDKAIEVFIKALEVDSETVELHLALGGLFRRKGQVDRATRLHQNLIARPSLTDEQRLQAIYELAHDYYKAGLLDRAENLFLELKESEPYRQQAIDGLSNIYEQEKEWQSAIDVLRAHKRTDRPMYTKQMAHFWCELAELAIFEQNYNEARKCLRSALSEDKSTARAILLKGELAYQQKEFRKAIGLWQTLVVSRPRMAELVVDKMIASYKGLNDSQGLEEYLVAESSIPKSAMAFDLWRETLNNQLGEEAALELIFTKVHKEGLSGPVANYLATTANNQQLSLEHRSMLLKDVLNRAKNRKIEYTCGGCGFAIKAMYWHCPNCGEWESFA